MPVWPCWANLNFERGQGAAAGSDLAVVVLQLRLVFPGVHLRDRPFHEQEDDPLGLHAEVRRLGGEQALADGCAVLAAASRGAFGRAARRARR